MIGEAAPQKASRLRLCTSQIVSCLRQKPSPRKSVDQEGEVDEQSS